jgi:hypothetical protein
MLVKEGLKAALIEALSGAGFPLVYEVQGVVQDTGLEKFCDKLAEAIVNYVKANAEVHIPTGVVVVSVAGPGVTYVVNPADIVLTVL